MKAIYNKRTKEILKWVSGDYVCGEEEGVLEGDFDNTEGKTIDYYELINTRSNVNQYKKRPLQDLVDDGVIKLKPNEIIKDGVIRELQYNEINDVKEAYDRGLFDLDSKTKFIEVSPNNFSIVNKNDLELLLDEEITLDVYNKKKETSLYYSFFIDNLSIIINMFITLVSVKGRGTSDINLDGTDLNNLLNSFFTILNKRDEELLTEEKYLQLKEERRELLKKEEKKRSSYFRKNKSFDPEFINNLEDYKIIPPQYEDNKN